MQWYGEYYFQSGEMEKARNEYIKALEISPNNSQLMTFIGQTYGIEQNYEKAEEWYKKAIKANYIDYLAHWFLADIYLIKADTKKAVEKITISHILNRNNPRLFEKLTIIYNENGMRYANWKFKPLYKMSKNDDNSISLEYDPEHSEWMMYMLCKAVWAYEPGYKENMLKNAKEIPRLVEEKECLANLVIGYKNKNMDKKSDDEALNKLIEAVDNDMLSEFILYEILLKEDPSIAYKIGKKSIEKIVDYVLKFRTEKFK